MKVSPTSTLLRLVLLYNAVAMVLTTTPRTTRLMITPTQPALPPLTCNEAALARCLQPLANDAIFGATLTTSGALDLVKVTEEGEALCRSYVVVERCSTIEMNKCDYQVSGTYSAIVNALKSYCDDGYIHVLTDFPCLKTPPFLAGVAKCQQAAGLHVDIPALVCRTSPSLRGCVDAQVLQYCDVMALERYQTLSEAMLLPLRQRHGCPPDAVPGPVRGGPPPADCGPQLPDCLRHLAALTGSAGGSFEVADILTRAPSICRAYTGVQQCVPVLRDCQEAVSDHLKQYVSLSAFCSLNLTALEQHVCLQQQSARQAATQCASNLMQTEDRHVNACRYIFSYKSCLGRAVATSCGTDIIGDVTRALDATFEPITISTKCARVIPAYIARPCLGSEGLAGRLEVCQQQLDAQTDNRTTDCSVLLTFDLCVQQATRTVCGDDAASAILPLVERVSYDFYSRYPACSKQESNQGKPTIQSRPNVDQQYEGLVTPQIVAFVLLGMCALTTIFALCGAYCVLRRDSTRRRKGRNMWSPGDAAWQGQGQGSSGQQVRSSESALEVEEVKVEHQSIEDNYAW